MLGVASKLTLQRSGEQDAASNVGGGRQNFGVEWVRPVKFEVSHCFNPKTDKANITLEDDSKTRGRVGKECAGSNVL